MKIEIRKIGPYYECDVVDGSTTMHLGLLDRGECETVAGQFRAAADELFPIEERGDAPLQRKCLHPLSTRPILYTDSVGGEQVCRDDLWAVTTDELNALRSETAPTREAVLDWAISQVTFEAAQQLRALKNAAPQALQSAAAQDKEGAARITPMPAESAPSATAPNRADFLSVPPFPTLEMSVEGAVEIQKWDAEGGSQTNAAAAVYIAMVRAAPSSNERSSK